MTTESSLSTTEPTSTSPVMKVEDPEQLLVAVRSQIEYYFSKDNLRSDVYLLSQMDSQNSVPLATVMSFAKLRSLTTDENVVIEAVKTSPNVSYTDGRIKALAKSGRSTIILRDISSDTPEEKIREIFSFPGCKPISSVRSEIGDTWFITMESEEDAKDTLMDLKLKKRTFDGVPVKARLKTEAVVRSYYPTPGMGGPMAGPMGGYPPVPFPPYGAAGASGEGGAGAFGYGSVPAGQQGPAGDRDNRRQNRHNGDGEKSSPNSRSGGRHHDKNHGNDGEGSTRRDRRSNSHGGGSAGGKGRDKEGSRKGGHGKGHGRERREGHGSGGPQNRQHATPAIEINSSADFPPLPPQGTEEGGSAPTSPTAIPARGFQGPYIKYSIDDIIQIVTNIKEAVLPDTIHPADHPAAMTVTPNTDLLQRQRTFSIDETREQMQQGRPVQREAVLAGAVDYGSLLYGEDYQQGQAQQQQGGGKKSEGGSWVGVLLKSGGSVDTYKPPVPKKTVEKAAPSAPAASNTIAPVVGGDKRVEGGGKKKASEGRREDSSNRKSDKKGQGRDRKRQEGSGKGGGTSDTTTPSSWGGRPTFANVLKQQEAEAAAAALKEASNSSNPSSNPPTEKPVEGKSASSGHSRSRDNRGGNEKNSRSNAPHYHQKKSSPHGSAADGTWSKEKLPPLPRDKEAS